VSFSCFFANSLVHLSKLSSVFALYFLYSREYCLLMKVTVILGALVFVTKAHSDPRHGHASIPMLMGGRKFKSQFQARKTMPATSRISVVHVEARGPVVDTNLEERENTNDECGAGIGSCVNECCSAAGYGISQASNIRTDKHRYCGLGSEYCAAPDCQFLYGPDCDANQFPAGKSTRDIPRPQLGSIEYGGNGIYDIVVPGGMLLRSFG